MNWKQLKQAAYIPGLRVWTNARLGICSGAHRDTVNFSLHKLKCQGANVYTWWRFQLTIFKEQP